MTRRSQCASPRRYSRSSSFSSTKLVVRRAGTTDSSRDPLDGLREAHRVEPDVRILSWPEKVERAAVSRLDRILERGLEAAADVDDEFGVADRLDVARRQLDVVGLDTGRREVDDLVRAARDLLGRPGEWIEGGDVDPRLARESSAFDAQPASASVASRTGSTQAGPSPPGR